jgi:hypothetical protein
MTPAANPPDDPRPQRTLAAALGFSLLLLVGAATALSTISCSKPPASSTTDTISNGAKVDAWKQAAAKLRKDTDPASVKLALGLLGGEKFPALSDEALAAVGATVPLSPADQEEIRGAAFSSFDPTYLADCFYLRDAARSLGLTGVPPEQQVDLAFAWVCRQVYLHPWLRHLGGNAFEPTALPPTAVLRRGFGSGLERMYVFLALLQQLELDGCLIGSPESGNQAARVGAPGGPTIKYPTVPSVAVPRGPFWAVGVRVGSDVRLFDPWRGTALPVTLNQLKANPDAAKAWFEDKANLSGSTLDDAKKATVFLAVPVNSLSARMAVFEQNLKGELGVKVAFDQKARDALRAAFPDPKPAFWNPPNDPFAYGRAARSFAPVDAGGTDSAPPGQRLTDAYYREQIPADALATPGGLRADSVAAARLRQLAAGSLAASFIEPPNPRERIQRGQFQDAAKDIVAKQDIFANGLERLRINRDADQQIREWIKAAGEVYQQLGAAQLRNDKEAEAAAKADVELLWKQPGALFLIDKASAEVGRAEASLLLALCKHEMAERLQARLERAAPADVARLKADALDAWKTALAAWRTYEQMATAHAGFPGRATHAKALAERAAKFLEIDAKK